jgi:hypothetical protein
MELLVLHPVGTLLEAVVAAVIHRVHPEVLVGVVAVEAAAL